ncbi:hypothetical protein GEMRC1_003176 [Eukaryota sp. GEM-RC1]
MVHVAGTNNQWADMLSRVIDRRPVETIKSLTISNLSIKSDLTLSYEGLLYDDADCVEMLPRDSNVLAIKCLRNLSTDNKLPLFDSWLSTIRSEQSKAIEQGDQLFNGSTLCTMSNVYMNSKNKILIPSSLIKKVLHMLHGLVQSGHPNKKRSLEILFNSGYFWPTIASGDSEERIVVKILDRFDTPDGEFCTVLWFGGDTSSVPIKDIKNTKAYSNFVKLDNLDLFRDNRNSSSNNNTKLKRT